MPDLAGPKVAYLGYCGLIDAQGITRIAQMLNSAVNEQFDSVYLCFSSAGGYVGDGIFLYNHIRSLPIPVTIHNTGTVASIAATLFVAADHRKCSQHSIFMMHPVATGASGALSTDVLLAALDSAQRDEARTEAILRDRTRIPDEVLTARRTRDVYITAEQALQFGLAHDIADFVLPRQQDFPDLRAADHNPVQNYRVAVRRLSPDNALRPSNAPVTWTHTRA